MFASDNEEQDKLNKEEQIDDFEIKLQFMPIMSTEGLPTQLEMNIDADI